MPFSPEKFRGEFGVKPRKEIAKEKELRKEELRKVLSELEIEVKGEKIVFSPKEIKKLLKPQIMGRYTPATLLQIIPERIPERFKRNVENSGIEPKEWKKICIKMPVLLLIPPETLKKNIEVSSRRLGLSEKNSLN